MAEQQKYQRRLEKLRLANLSVRNEREESVGQAELSRKLDRLGNFFIDRAAKRVALEGAEYGADNAPTIQQIQDAVDSGTEIDLPGNLRSIRGRAARKAALESVYDNFSLLTERQILDIVNNQSLDDFDVKDIQERTNTVIDVYSTLLNKQSPSLARKLRASTSLTAYQTISSRSKEFLKRQEVKDRNNILSGIDDYVLNIYPALLESGGAFTINDNAEIEETMPGYELATQKNNAVKLNIIGRLAALGENSERVATIANDFDKAIATQNKNHIFIFFAEKNLKNSRTFLDTLQNSVRNPNAKSAKNIPNEIKTAFYSLNREDRQKVVDDLLKKQADNIKRELELEEKFSKIENNIEANQVANIFRISDSQEKARILDQNPDLRKRVDALSKVFSSDDDVNFFLSQDSSGVERYLLRDALGDMEISRDQILFLVNNGVIDIDQAKPILDYRVTRINKKTDQYIEYLKQVIDNPRIEGYTTRFLAFVAQGETPDNALNLVLKDSDELIKSFESQVESLNITINEIKAEIEELESEDKDKSLRTLSDIRALQNEKLQKESERETFKFRIKNLRNRQNGN